MAEVTPVTGKGNRTANRTYLTEGVGNKVPLELRALPEGQAQKTISQYNAEATYNNFANNQALEHLKNLHYSLGALHEATQDPTIGVARHMASEAYNTAQRTGFVGHPDIIGEQATEGDQAGKFGISGGHISNIISTLKNVHPATLPAHAQTHLTNALNAANGVLHSFNVAGPTDYKANSTGEGRMSVYIEPDYRAHSFDYPRSAEDLAADKADEAAHAAAGRKGEAWEGRSAAKAHWNTLMRQTADGLYALRAQGKLPDPEASRKSANAGAKVAAKAERRASNETAAREAEL